VEVLDNIFRGQPTVKARADNLKILRNTLAGTVQIFPGSDDVIIEDNRILKSYGAGIQLGGVSKADASDLYSADRKAIYEKRYAKYEAEAASTGAVGAVAAEKASATGETASFGTPVMKVDSVNSRYTVGVDRDLFFTTRLVRVSNNLIGGCLGSGIITTNNIKTVLPLHPRTLKVLAKNLKPGLFRQINTNQNIKIIPPVSFFDTMILIKNSKLILTDSGGVQKEAYFHKKPVLVLRSETEWIEILENSGGRIVDADPVEILAGYQFFHKNRNLKFPMIFGNGKAAEFICNEIVKHSKS